MREHAAHEQDNPPRNRRCVRPRIPLAVRVRTGANEECFVAGGVAEGLDRTQIIAFLAGHTWDIYGQMAVYLRLNGLVPPASQAM
jgi:hypothetical protein